MTVQQTSLFAYAQIREELGERQQQVLDAITVFGPLSNKDIAKRLHLDINSVTPRCLELRKKGLVELDRVDVGAGGRKACYWRSV